MVGSNSFMPIAIAGIEAAAAAIVYPADTTSRCAAISTMPWTLAFRPGFLNRIDDIVVLHPLGMADIERIVDVWFADVRELLACERMTLRIAAAANWIYVRRHVLTLTCFLRR